MMRNDSLRKQFLRKTSELFAGLFSMFGFYTAMFVTVYNITFNQECFYDRSNITLTNFLKVVLKALKKLAPKSNQRNNTFLMWVEDGVVDVPFFDRNSYIPDWNRPNKDNSTLYSLHNGIFHTTTKKDQFIDRNQLQQIMANKDGLKVRLSNPLCINTVQNNYK